MKEKTKMKMERKRGKGQPERLDEVTRAPPLLTIHTRTKRRNSFVLSFARVKRLKGVGKTNEKGQEASAPGRHTGAARAHCDKALIGRCTTTPSPCQQNTIAFPGRDKDDAPLAHRTSVLHQIVKTSVNVGEALLLILDVNKLDEV
jgi:hypothetical protein